MCTRRAHGHNKVVRTATKTTTKYGQQYTLTEQQKQ